jgi:PII-like signaling protein
MNEDCVKLTIYFGERDRAQGRFLGDALTEIYARHKLRTSLVMRGAQGFGIKHHLHTDHLLSLSEDLPLVSVAIDAKPRIDMTLGEVNRLRFDGLVTLERASLYDSATQPNRVPSNLPEEVKLTLYIGRHERAAGRPAYEVAVDLLHKRGMAGATVLLAVDGTAHGIRQRARFFGANKHVPLMVIAVGDGQRITELLPELAALVPRTLITLERVRVCKRDGHKLADPERLPQTDPSGFSVWQKLMVYAGEQARSDGHPLHHQLITALRRAGAAGATSVRGVWGYHGDHEPHGDSFWQLRRRTPILTVIVDTPERTATWFTLIDQLTSQTGLVTSEMVPAFRATGPALTRGGLRLARLGPGQAGTPRAARPRQR